MNTAEGNAQTAGAWETFILASCVPLGKFEQVHLAPRFPPGRLNMAMRTELPLLDNELLVALIDSDSGGFQSVVVLTSWRIYWSVREGQEAGGPAGKGRTPAIRSYAMDYAVIPEAIGVRSSGEGVAEISLGGRGILALTGAEPGLAEALANYLRTVGTAARTGVIPRLSEQDPELATRIAGVLPRVAEVTARIRTLGRDLHAFRRDLMAATPRSIATTAFTIACVAVYAAMVLSGVEPIIPTTTDLLAWGANDGARVVLRHEYWRMPASVFIHGGLIHLGVNMWCLYSIGPLVERLFGNLAFAALYLAAGIGGAIASMATLPFRVSVGASGAIFGILGALLAFLIVHRRSVPSSVLKPLRSSALSFVIFNTLFGAAVPNIDQSAHMGGLATGFLGGILLTRPWPVVRSTVTTLRRVALGVVLAGALLGIGRAAIAYRERTLPPEVLYADFTAQIAPAMEKFNEIVRTMGPISRLRDAAESPEGRDRLASTAHDLLARSKVNRERLGHVMTPDLDLLRMRQLLIDSQDGETAVLEAIIRHLETPDPASSSAAQEIDEGRQAMDRSIREYEKLNVDYLTAHGLAKRPRAPAEWNDVP